MKHRHKFSGEICIYCNNAPAQSRDHAVGKKFFLVERRDNLPEVPACEKCNNAKSKFENYLMIVLPFGAKHKDARANLLKLVQPRLENKANAKLLRKLKTGYARSGGTSIPLNHEPLEKLFAMIAKALAWRHFGVRLGEGHSAIASLFTNEGETWVNRMLASEKNRVSGNLGEGTFTFEGVQSEKYPGLTMWRFRIYGGVDFGGDPNVHGAASLAVAVTGRLEMIQNLRYADFLKDRKAPKVGRNDPCPCGSGKKHKKCHGSLEKIESRAKLLSLGRAARPLPQLSVYQPLAAHGYGPHQLTEMARFVETMRPAR
jgi:hypothetical protein